jgi:hypothetical protein
MEQFIARENITRFKAALQGETDPVRLKTLNELLAIEEAKMFALQYKPAAP